MRKSFVNWEKQLQGLDQSLFSNTQLVFKFISSEIWRTEKTAELLQNSSIEKQLVFSRSERLPEANERHEGRPDDPDSCQDARWLTKGKKRCVELHEKTLHEEGCVTVERKCHVRGGKEGGGYDFSLDRPDKPELCYGNGAGRKNQ